LTGTTQITKYGAITTPSQSARDRHVGARLSGNVRLQTLITGIGWVSETRYVKTLFGLLISALVLVGCDSGGSTELWPFEKASITPDGSSVQVSAFLPGDPGCHVFDHIDTEVEGDALVISLYYRRTDQRSCILPCPFGTVVHEAELDPPVSPSLTPVRNPATPRHCSESP
jgi:hypothetical protein